MKCGGQFIRASTTAGNNNKLKTITVYLLSHLLGPQPVPGPLSRVCPL